MFPAKSEREIDEKRKAESPKPEMTSPVVIPLCRLPSALKIGVFGRETHHMIWERLCSRVHGARQPSISTCACKVAAYNQGTESQQTDTVLFLCETSIVQMADTQVPSKQKHEAAAQ